MKGKMHQNENYGEYTLPCTWFLTNTNETMVHEIQLCYVPLIDGPKWVLSMCETSNRHSVGI